MRTAQTARNATSARTMASVARRQDLRATACLASGWTPPQGPFASAGHRPCDCSCYGCRPRNHPPPTPVPVQFGVGPPLSPARLRHGGKKETSPSDQGGPCVAKPRSRPAALCCRTAPWLSFGTAQRRDRVLPATLSKALSRPCLVYPLASLDVPGQRPVSCADASPNEVFSFARSFYHFAELLSNRQC
jgi:hypothetical protein